MRLPPDILTALLRGEDLDVERRDALGSRPEEALRYAEVRDHLAAVIAQTDWFPKPWREHVPGEFVDENIVIERVGAGRRRWPGSVRFVCHARRHHPIDPTALVEESHRKFRSARGAAEYYLHFQLGLPGDLDGWKVAR